jgi:hypothetical protein
VQPIIHKSSKKSNDLNGSDKTKTPNKRKSKKLKIGSAARSEKRHLSMITIYSLLIIFVLIVVMGLILCLFGDGIGSWQSHISSTMDSLIAAAIVLIFLDSVNMFNNENRKQREERRAIIRHNKIIQPMIDMYLARKNMVITPNEMTLKKFQINTTFRLCDLKDMYGPSNLVSDVGKSKIEVYQYYQDKLVVGMSRLVESVDFASYQDLCDAGMNYINATTYGASALEAVVEYQDATSGTRSVKSMVINMIINEPENGKFAYAEPMMKNVYLVHQMIMDQQKALEDYLDIIEKINAQEPKNNRIKHQEYE